MIKIENTEVFGLESAIRGMRNPLNSWDKSDSHKSWDGKFCIGEADLKLMKSLVKAGSDHSKFMRMINVTFDITAPLYWWKEFDTYKIGTVRNSCSTMHKIAEKEFTIDDFSYEHLINMYEEEMLYSENALYCCDSIDSLEQIIAVLNAHRSNYLNTKNKKYWWQMIQLLPSSYNQRATIQLNYAVLRNIYHSRKNHKLDEWREFCKWIETLPYSELITSTKQKAKWLKADDEICYSEKCSACGWQGRVCRCGKDFCDIEETKNFCPNCGAEMEVQKDD